MTRDVPPSPCPFCGTVSKKATPVADVMPREPESWEVPEPGCFSVCLGCGVILRFDERMRLAAFGTADIDRLSKLPPETVRALMICQQAVLHQKAVKAAMN